MQAASTPRNAGPPHSPSSHPLNRKMPQLQADPSKKTSDAPARDEFTKATFTAAQKTLREQRYAFSSPPKKIVHYLISFVRAAHYWQNSGKKTGSCEIVLQNCQRRVLREIKVRSAH